MDQLLPWSPTKTFIPSIFDEHLLSIYYVPGSLLGNGDIMVKKTEKVPAFQELLFQTFLLFETSTRLIIAIFDLGSHPSFAFWFLFLRFKALWEKVRDHVLSILKVYVNFSWAITATQWCLSSSCMYRVISGYNTRQQILHLCSSNYLPSPQSLNCPLHKQWPGLGLRRHGMTLSESFFSVKWNGWTGNIQGFILLHVILRFCICSPIQQRWMHHTWHVHVSFFPHLNVWIPLCILF